MNFVKFITHFLPTSGYSAWKKKCIDPMENSFINVGLERALFCSLLFILRKTLHVVTSGD
jgi:hypothetical protein